MTNNKKKKSKHAQLFDELKNNQKLKSKLAKLRTKELKQYYSESYPDLHLSDYFIREIRSILSFSTSDKLITSKNEELDNSQFNNTDESNKSPDLILTSPSLTEKTNPLDTVLVSREEVEQIDELNKKYELLLNENSLLKDSLSILDSKQKEYLNKLDNLDLTSNKNIDALNKMYKKMSYSSVTPKRAIEINNSVLETVVKNYLSASPDIANEIVLSGVNSYEYVIEMVLISYCYLLGYID